MTLFVLQLMFFFNFKVVVCTFGGAFNGWFGIKGFTCQAVIHFVISGGAFRAGRGSQRRLRFNQFYVRSLNLLVLLG